MTLAINMATLNHYVNGGFYITNAYPFKTRNGDQDAFFSHVKVLPRAERFFELAQYRHGRVIEKAVYYALLLDGDLTSDSIERRRPTVVDMPSHVLYVAEGLAEDASMIRMLRDPKIVSSRCLADYFSAVRAFYKSATVDLIANMCLARHIRQYAYDREKNKKS